MHVFFAVTFTGKNNNNNKTFFLKSHNKRPLHKIAQSPTNAGN